MLIRVRVISTSRHEVSPSLSLIINSTKGKKAVYDDVTYDKFYDRRRRRFINKKKICDNTAIKNSWLLSPFFPLFLALVVACVACTSSYDD